MKESTKNKITSLFCLFIATAFSIFFLLFFIQNIILVINHDEIEVTITNVTYEHHYKSSDYKYDFEYFNDGKIYRNQLEVGWNLFSSFFHNKYSYGEKVIVLYNSYFNLMKFRDYILRDTIFYFLLFIFFCFVILVFLFISKDSLVKKQKVKSYFYVQNNNYRIKKIKFLETGLISKYVNEIEQGKIICYGFYSNKDFIEFSYSDGCFYMRKGNEEELIELSREDVMEKSDKLRKKCILNTGKIYD